MQNSLDKMFSLDHPFFSLMTKLFDICLANILWLICAVPVFTIGPATQALYYVSLKIAESKEGNIIQSYFRAFRNCFWQSVSIGLIMSGAGAFLLLEVYLCHMAATTFYRWLLLIFLFLLFIWLCILMYVFAVQARFDNPVKTTLRISAALAFHNFPKTLLMLISSFVFFSVILFVPIFLIVNIGLLSVINSALLLKSFAPYLPNETEEIDTLNQYVEEDGF